MDKQQQEKAAFLVGICGGSGSGKSALAAALLDVLQPEMATLISLDAYYHSQSDVPAAVRGNMDHPDALDADLLVEHLQALHQGQSIARPVYDFCTHARTTETQTMHKAPLMIMDGILLFALPGVAEQLDVSVYVDAPADVRLGRRLQRDRRERGRTTDDVLAQYFSTVRPMYERYVKPGREQADLVVSSLDAIDVGLQQVLLLLQQHLGKRLSAWLKPDAQARFEYLMIKE